MEITTEQITTILERLNRYCIAKYDGERPDRFELDNNGINAVWVDWEGCDCASAYIKPEDLNTDLDEVVRLRKKQEEKERIKKEAEDKRIRLYNEEIMTEKRRQEYLKLKKEFGE
jgi:hypothetical protein